MPYRECTLTVTMMATTITMMISTAENAPVRAAGSQVGVESITICAVVGESTNGILM